MKNLINYIKNKEDTISSVIFVGVILFFYYIGLYYTALIFVSIGLLFIVTLAMKLAKSKGGEVSGLMFLPAFFILLFGVVLLLIDSF